MGSEVIDETNETYEGFEVLKYPEPDTEIAEEIENKEGETVEETKPIESVEEIEYDDTKVLNYFKSKGKEIASIDDLFKEKENVKEVNPYDDVMDDEDKEYYKFKRDIGGSRKDFEFLKEDISKVSALDLAIQRIKFDTSLSLTKEEAVEYLEEKLGIDLSDEELSVKTRIELNGYAKPQRERLLAEQEKYRTPLESLLKSKEAEKVEMVQLDNGTKMPKSEYDAWHQNREKYLKDVTNAVDSVAASDFKMFIDDNGEKREFAFNYEYSKEDKHSMLSDVSDVDAMIQKRYQTKEGLNHKELAKALWWGEPKNQQKVITAAMERARAEAIEETISNANNENFSGKALPKSKKIEDGYVDPSTLY